MKMTSLLIGVAGLMVIGAPVMAVEPLPAETTFQAPSTPSFHPEQVLVRFMPGTARDQVNATITKAGAKGILMSYPLVPDLYCVQVPAGSPEQVVKQLRAMTDVKYAEFDYIRHAFAQTTPYGITMVQAPTTWTQSRGNGVRVAVLDTGVDLTHPDLPVPVLTQSFISGEAVDDLHSHGTHTAGTVLAIDNTIGVVGVAPQAQLMVGKVLGNGGSGADSGVMAGINWAVLNDAKVVSMSLGGAGFSQAGQDTITAAVAANVLIVASAGNDNSDDFSYPASYDGCMSIAAIDENMARASFSNFGSRISVTGPGVNVQSTVPIISANVTWSGTPRTASVMTGSAIGTATGTAVYCGTGAVASDFPPAVAGNIAHVRRGPDANGDPVTFQTKVLNALNAGAVGVVISNNTTGTLAGTLNFTAPVPVLGITQANGNTLQSAGAVTTTLSIAQTGHGYANFSGTSMSCPHVSGVAALLIAGVAPASPTPAQLREALEQSATDLGDAGWDPLFGHGLVNAQAALAYLRGEVGGCGTSDFNGDGDFGTDADIEAFFACLAGTCCPTCLSAGADFNMDGDTGTDADIEAFFRVLAGGSC